MGLEISAQPKLRVGGLHIANAPGFDWRAISPASAKRASPSTSGRCCKAPADRGSHRKPCSRAPADKRRWRNNWTFKTGAFAAAQPRTRRQGHPPPSTRTAHWPCSTSSRSRSRIERGICRPGRKEPLFRSAFAVRHSPLRRPAAHRHAQRRRREEISLQARFHRRRTADLSIRQAMARQPDAHFPEFDADRRTAICPGTAASSDSASAPRT